MGLSALNIAIENAFTTAWASATSIRYENVEFTIPSTSWVEILIRSGKGIKGSLGTGVQLRRRLGTVFVNIFTPLKQGAKPANLLADDVIAIFQDLTVSGITFFEAETTTISEKYYSNSGGGVSATSQWFQMVVAVPFKYDEYV